MNSSLVSWRDLNDLILRSLRSLALKLVLISLLFSFAGLCFRFQSFTPDRLEMELKNSTISISNSGKSNVEEIDSFFWFAGKESCTGFRHSRGFAFTHIGDCPPSVKIMNAKNAGLDGIIFYASAGTILKLHDTYDIYVFQSDIDLRNYTDFTHFILIPDSDKQSLFRFILSEAFSDLILSFYSGLTVLLTGFLIILFQNYKEDGKFRVKDAIIKGCLILLDIDVRGYAPRLYAVPFPELKIARKNLETLTVSKNDLELGNLSFSQDCCVICLEDLEEDHLVRSLPCHHIFHSECIDPWFLNHKRLCPVCKSDVLASSS